MEDTNKNEPLTKDSTIDNIEILFSGVTTTIGQFRNQITTLNTQFKELEKQVKKEMKQLRKETEKIRSKPKRKPSGFAGETKISDELCDFMGLEHGSKIARTEVTKYLSSYIKENNLSKKQIIDPDEKLKNLLGDTENSEVTFFNIQRYMNKHFVRA